MARECFNSGWLVPDGGFRADEYDPAEKNRVLFCLPQFLPWRFLSNEKKKKKKTGEMHSSRSKHSSKTPRPLWKTLGRSWGADGSSADSIWNRATDDKETAYGRER